MQELTYIIDSSNGGKLVKTFLRNHLGVSARVLSRLKDEPQGITVNGEQATVRAVLFEGDSLCLRLGEEDAEERAYVPEDIPLAIIYEDDHFLIVDKPADMAMYPVGNHGGGCLLNAVANYDSTLVFRPLYRLDRNTSGLVVAAKSRLASSSVAIRKNYLALCCGELPSQGEISTRIGLESGSKIKRTTGYGQEALTRFETITVQGGYSLVRVKIETGRTHQIRVHMASIGFPLAGDDLYGGNCQRLTRQALHCAEISLLSTAVNLHRVFSSEMPDDLKTAFPEFFSM